MPNRSTDALFQLIHSLQKSEKRNFKLYVKRNSSNQDLKIVQLFDAIDKMSNYDENLLLTKTTSIKKQQLPNIKAHLYKQILSSLRLLEGSDNHQSLRFLEKIKEAAKESNQLSILIEVLMKEKKIETLHITRSMEDRAEALTSEVNNARLQYTRESLLSNLALKLYSWYIKNGFARNEADEKEIETYFLSNLTDEIKKPEGFFQKLYFSQSYCWYGLFDVLSVYPEMGESI